MARLTTKGRRKCGPPFIQLPHWVYDSAAYQGLKPGPRALLLAVQRRYNGSNNGCIGLGLREAAAECNVSDKDTISAYFAALEDRGFLRATFRGGFNLKDPTQNRATEWRLTWLDAPGIPPTKEFMDWTPVRG